jgi:predicted enzyme related to lactoylglutathione lyase
MVSTGVKTQVGQFIWHDLLTTDVERGKRFYTELLGWEVAPWKPGEIDYPIISSNGVMHGGFGVVEDGSPQWIGHAVVEDVAEAVARAERAGGTVRGEPGGHPEVGSWATIVDPQGGEISAFKPNYDSPAPSGVFVWDELVTPDAEAAKAFYGAVFGWTAEPMDMGDMGVYTIFKKGDGESVAGMMQKRDGDAGPAGWLPYLRTDDVDASAARAAELGARTLVEPMQMESAGRFAVLVDPTGATFGLHKDV